MTEMVVVDAVASRNSNRREILVTGDTGEQVEIIACEQRRRFVDYRWIMCILI